tara:strand:- start:73 stop:639 length:567 start_codon:yes stop_codon:yes gene_type:complete
MSGAPYFKQNCGYQDNSVHKTMLNTPQVKSLRQDVIRAIDFLEKHKYQIGQNDYKNLFNQYQHVLNIYNNMIDRNLVQSKYIDPRTVVQTQPIIDGPEYDVEDWEKQFTANNLQIEPYTIPPINAFRRIKDYNKYMGAQAKRKTMETSADESYAMRGCPGPINNSRLIGQPMQYGKFKNSADLSMNAI